jgi:glycyl-tRNA synthetase beta subunit
VDALFDEVENMAKDPQLRAQRLGALLRLRNLYLKWADFSKLSS